MKHLSSHTAAFTLIELSIVLVILALLVGGTLTGKELLTNAKLRAVHSNAEKYARAVREFEDKYDALPGDMANAIDIWGAEHSTPSVCIDTESTNRLTCNGNGDGKIGGTSATGYEIFRAWQQLKNADFVTGVFTGTSESPNATAPYHTEIGQNVPKADIKGVVGYGMRYESAGGHFAQNIPFHYIVIGGDVTDNYNDSGALSNQDAYNIDVKGDDGLPGQGKIVTRTSTSQSTCASTSSANSAAYQLGLSNETACAVYFRIPLED